MYYVYINDFNKSYLNIKTNLPKVKYSAAQSKTNTVCDDIFSLFTVFF